MDQTVSNGLTSIKGVEIELTRRGSGKPMLLLHGGSGPQPDAPFAKKLMERYDVLVPAHPGFSRSPLPDNYDSIDDLAYLYLDLLEQFDLNDVILVGFSLGGWLAAEIAVRNTSRISKLALVDAVGIKVGDRETRDIADIFALPPDKLTPLMFHDPANAPDISNLSDEEMLIRGRNREAMALYGWEPYLHNPKLRQRLHRIDVPTLVIWGASDGLVKPAYGRAYAESIPGASFVAIQEAGHTPQTEQCDAFVEQLTEFAG